MTIKLEVGRRYVDGIDDEPEAIVGRDEDGFYISSGGGAYTEDGRYVGALGPYPAGHAFNLIALAPDEAPSGEAALDALTELDQLRARVKELEEWNRKMVEMAASKNNLDGYRELGQRAAQAEADRDALRAENARLREALEPFAKYGAILMGQRVAPDGCVVEIFDCRITVADFHNAALARTEAENG